MRPGQPVSRADLGNGYPLSLNQDSCGLDARPILRIMTRLLAIDGSYRDGGAIDQAVALVVDLASSRGIRSEIVRLRDYPIEFCRNCRQCTQQIGDAPGICVQQDGMRDLIDKIEAADYLVLASPTNFSTATAVFKRFMERLIVYAYWPWGANAPRLRRKRPTRSAMLIASSAAPRLLAMLAFSTMRQLKMTAKTVGARPAAVLHIGLMSRHSQPQLPPRVQKRVRRLAEKMLQDQGVAH